MLTAKYQTAEQIAYIFHQYFFRTSAMNYLLEILFNARNMQKLVFYYLNTKEVLYQVRSCH